MWFYLQTPSDEKTKCGCIPYWCPHPSSSSPRFKPSKIYFLCWPWVWLVDLEKQRGCPDIHQLAWTILSGKKETGSSDHPSLWLMLQRVFRIWHVIAELMPARLVLTYWAGRQTCIHVKCSKLKRNQLVSSSSWDKQQAVLPFLTPDVLLQWLTALSTVTGQWECGSQKLPYVS